MNRMNIRPLVTVAATLIAACSLGSCAHKSAVNTVSSGANQRTTGGVILVPAGAVYFGKLAQPIDTKTSNDNDAFALDEVRSSDKSLTGATIDGHLQNVSAAGPMRRPSLTEIVHFRQAREVEEWRGYQWRYR